MGLMARRWILNVTAAIWSFAEATLFFIVVDVLLSSAVVTGGWRSAGQAALWAVGGALAGGTAMYLWAVNDPQAALTAIRQVPYLDHAMIAEVWRTLGDDGLFAVILAGVTGVPYKIYAIAVPGEGIGMAPFLAVSAGARLGRFLLAVILATFVNACLEPFLGRRLRLLAMVGLWVVFYAHYWGYLDATPLLDYLDRLAASVVQWVVEQRATSPGQP